MSSLALDVGSKRIGVALGDPTETFAFPLPTIERTNLRADIARIRALVEEHGVRDLVVGDPIALDGSRKIAAEKIDAFVEHLQSALTVPIHRIDERMTSAQANKALIAADLSRERRKRSVDAFAAVLILESYQARRRRERERST